MALQAVSNRGCQRQIDIVHLIDAAPRRTRRAGLNAGRRSAVVVEQGLTHLVELLALGAGIARVIDGCEAALRHQRDPAQPIDIVLEVLARLARVGAGDVRTRDALGKWCALVAVAPDKHY